MERGGSRCTVLYAAIGPPQGADSSPVVQSAPAWPLSTSLKQCQYLWAMARVAKFDHLPLMRVILGQGIETLHLTGYRRLGRRRERTVWMMGQGHPVKLFRCMEKELASLAKRFPEVRNALPGVGLRHFENIERSSLASRHDR